MVGASGRDVSSLIVEMLGIHSSAKNVESQIRRSGSCRFMQCEVGATLPSPSVPSPAAVSSAAVQPRRRSVVGQKRKRKQENQGPLPSVLYPDAALSRGPALLPRSSDSQPTAVSSAAVQPNVRGLRPAVGQKRKAMAVSGSALGSSLDSSLGSVSSSGNVSSPSPPYAVGDRVEVYHTDKAYYPGIIKACDTAGATCAVAFDDGDTDDAVLLADIRPESKTSNSDACTPRAQQVLLDSLSFILCMHGCMHAVDPSFFCVHMQAEGSGTTRCDVYGGGRRRCRIGRRYAKEISIR